MCNKTLLICFFLWNFDLENVTRDKRNDQIIITEKENVEQNKKKNMDRQSVRLKIWYTYLPADTARQIFHNQTVFGAQRWSISWWAPGIFWSYL